MVSKPKRRVVIPRLSSRLNDRSANPPPIPAATGQGLTTHRAGEELMEPACKVKRQTVAWPPLATEDTSGGSAFFPPCEGGRFDATQAASILSLSILSPDGRVDNTIATVFS
jgi:hypothetical protein